MPLDIQAELKAAKSQLMKICQHPKAGRGVCGKMIDAHTVPRVSLSKMAQDGHVIQLNFTDPTAALRGGTAKIEARPRGIKEASTLPIFCGFHDNETFAPIESGEVAATPESALLFHYRATVRRWVNSEYARRGYERVWLKTESLQEPARTALREEIAFEVLGAHRRAAEEQSYKLFCDDLLAAGSTWGVRAVFVEFDELPHFMCCGSFEPLFDFAGNSLQQLAHPLARIAASIDPVALTVVGTQSDGGLAVLSSVGFGLAGERFLESFVALADSEKPDAIVRLAYNLVESVYFSWRWWHAMDAGAQAAFVEAANERYGNRLPDDVLAPRSPRLAEWAVSRVVVCGAPEEPAPHEPDQSSE